MLIEIAHVVVLLLGVSLVIATLFSAIRTFVLPRSANDRITRLLFLSIRFIFRQIMQPLRSYIQRDTILAYYAPICLLTLPAFWLTLILFGYMGIFWALDNLNWPDAFKLSGSSIFTLGYATFDTTLSTALTFSEALLGLILIALLIAEFFKIPYDSAPKPTDQISITREEFDAACKQLVAADVPLKPDLDQAWRDFVGWRINYDTVLIALAHLTMAPRAMWSSDRLPPTHPHRRWFS